MGTIINITIIVFMNSFILKNSLSLYLSKNIFDGSTYFILKVILQKPINRMDKE